MPLIACSWWCCVWWSPLVGKTENNRRHNVCVGLSTGKVRLDPLESKHRTTVGTFKNNINASANNNGINYVDVRINVHIVRCRILCSGVCAACKQKQQWPPAHIAYYHGEAIDNNRKR